MFNSTNSPFTIPVTPYEGNRSDGFGDGNGWWIILFVLFLRFRRMGETEDAITSPRKAASSLRTSVLEEKERSLLPDISTDFTKWSMKSPENALKPREKCQMWRIVQHHRRKTGIGRTFGR